MSVAQKTPDLQDNLASLREESFTFIAILSGVIGLVWFLWGSNTLYFLSHPPQFWIGVGLLLSSVIVSSMVKQKRLHIATHLLVWGILVTITCLVLGFPYSGTFFLFIFPIIFASALLSQEATFLVAGVTIALTISIGFTRVEIPFPATDGAISFIILGVMGPVFSSEIGFPVAIIALATIATWVSSRSVYTALAWAWHGYERARVNERIAQDNQAELKRVLKSLDDALYKLERANYKLSLARNQAEEARRLKQQFAQTISHELRTPLNLIVSFTELMAQSPEHYGDRLPLPYVRDLSIVYRNASHLQAMVNDVLDLARIEAAQMTIVPEKIDPTALVLEAVDTARSLIEVRGLKLYTNIEPDLPPLWVDPTRIRQVLFNLLNNAARFTDQGSVTIGVDRRGAGLVFAVTDTGMGIAPEDIPHIFEEFRQIDGSARRRHSGAGLGLVISKQFIELHGGNIWVESEGVPGQGSTFYFSLPVSEADLGTTSSGLGKVTHLVAGRSEEPIVLAVTRSPLAVALLTRYIQRSHTIVVQDLEQAGQVVQQSKPQVIVIDKACEGLDPMKMEMLGREWGLRHTPIVVCPLPGEEPLRQQLAVDGYLLKPISRQSLWDTLRQFGEKTDRILVIDDDQDFILLLSRILEDNPIRRYQVVSAGNGEEGLALIRNRRPDLILLDLMLPDITGFQIIEQLRSNPIWRHIPIVVVSAQDELDARETLTGAMMVAKPNGLRAGEVVRWVQNVLDATTQEPPPEDQITLSPTPSAPRVMPVL